MILGEAMAEFEEMAGLGDRPVGMAMVSQGARARRVKVSKSEGYYCTL